MATDHWPKPQGYIRLFVGDGINVHLPIEGGIRTPERRVRRRKVVVDGREYVALNAHDLLEATSDEHLRPGMPY